MKSSDLELENNEDHESNDEDHESNDENGFLSLHI